MSHDVLELFYIATVAEAEVDEIISNFRYSATGWNELSPSIIRTVKDRIKIPLAHIGNVSFDTGIFPVELKFPKLCLFWSLEIDIYFPIIGQYQYYMCFKKNGKIDVCSVDKLHTKEQHFIWISVWVSEGKINPHDIKYSGG